MFALAATSVAAGPRVVSINLCADQLLLSLADPDQILGLSPFARDRAQSWAAAQALRFPVLSGTAEEVFALKPDLVLAGLFTKRATRELLRSHGVKVVDLEVVTSIESAKQQILAVAGLLGQTDRGRAQVAEIDAALERAHRVRAGAAPRVLPLLRRGWVFGRDTLVSSLLAAAGFRNAGSELAADAVDQVTLEAIVAARPDLLLLTGAAERADDQGSGFLQHPALTGLYPAEKRIVLPERLTVCGGPMLAEALDLLSAAAERRP